MMASETCVCCGAEIPEGRQICSECARQRLEYGHFEGISTIDGVRHTHGGTMREMVDWCEEQLMMGSRDIDIWREE